MPRWSGGRNHVAWGATPHMARGATLGSGIPAYGCTMVNRLWLALACVTIPTIPTSFAGPDPVVGDVVPLEGELHLHVLLGVHRCLGVSACFFLVRLRGLAFSSQLAAPSS